MMLKAVNALAFKTCIEPSCCIHAMQLLDEDEGVMPRVCLDKDCLACEHKEPKPSCFVCSIQRGIERMMPAMPHHHMDRSGQVTAPAPLQCVLQPGKKLGAFSLGTSLSDAIQQVKHDPVSFPSCTLIYDETLPFQRPILLDIAEIGVQLRFDPKYQRLSHIEVYAFDALVISYQRKTFGGSPTRPTHDYERISAVFGGLTQAEYKEDCGAYVETFPGVQLSFAVPKRFQSAYKNKTHDLTKELQFPDGTPCLLTSLTVFSGQEPSSAPAPSRHITPVEVVVNKGIKVRGTRIVFGDTCQKVLTVLGAPDDVFYKTQDRMSIYNAHHPDTKTCTTPFFFNYLKLGFDILFRGTTKTVVKFIFHNNIPGHFDFSMYSRCHFTCPIAFKQQLQSGSPATSVVATQPQKQIQPVPLRASPPPYRAQPVPTASAQTASVSGFKKGGKSSSRKERKASGRIQSTRSAGSHPHRHSPRQIQSPVYGAASPDSDAMDQYDTPDDGDSQDEASSLVTGLDSIDLTESDVAPSPSTMTLTDHEEVGSHAVLLQPDTKWGTIFPLLRAHLGRSVSYNRAASSNASNPFKGTQLYSMEGLIFEVMHNEHIATITMFEQPKPFASKD
eukprot:m.12033 g.12033  ORF g.12033 m.12033 type:complete len:615 (-) comp5799_c0_seq1:307-2151(-)